MSAARTMTPLSPEAVAELRNNYGVDYHEILSVYNGIKRIAGYDLPVLERSRFARFRRWASSTPPPRRLEHLANTAQQWLKRFNDSIWHLENGLTAAHYHLARLKEMERKVTGLVARRVRKLMTKPNTVGGFGGTEKMDFEYQAFVFSLNRTLNYLAGMVAAYDKRECGSIRGLCKQKSWNRSAGLVDQILNRLTSMPDIVLLNKQDRKTVRDTIAHYHPVGAGTLNYAPGRVAFFGGGENITIDTFRKSTATGRANRLIVSRSLSDQYKRVARICLDSMRMVQSE